ncbi:MAG: hypothetical protein JSS32_05130 [Verrucomicrobia bacterium]|nr:hypothetical protein [Verrucomicrobiota bacterium]
MRKLFWMIFLFGAYIWIVTSGHEEFIFDQGRAVYRAVVAWFDDADVDFQVKKVKHKKKSRRWD